MKLRLNVLLAFLVSLALGLGVLEGGLRLTSFRPVETGTKYDPELGWAKQPGVTIHRKSLEFDFELTINELGLRDDPMDSPAKAPDIYRVLALGDSFTMGHTVPRSELFVDLLERWWSDEGRKTELINAGVEGYSTDQEARWLDLHGTDFGPNLVLVFPYENDIFWNGEASYLRFPKPRYFPDGSLEGLVIQDPGPRHWSHNFALTQAINALDTALRGKADGPLYFTPPNASTPIAREHAALLTEQPQFLDLAVQRTRGSLLAMQRKCAELGAELVVVPIPSKRAVESDERERFGRDILGLEPSAWSPNKPVDLFLELATELGIPTIDPRATFRAATTAGADLYYNHDWHLAPEGNRCLAQLLHDKLDSPALGLGLLQPAAGQLLIDLPERDSPRSFPTWALVYLGLLLGLAGLYRWSYQDESLGPIALRIAGLLGVVFALAMGSQHLARILPAHLATWLFGGLAILVLVTILITLRTRIPTILELIQAFVSRGHWYLLPVLGLLLSIGSLLLVAASSPLLSPFIYTLF